MPASARSKNAVSKQIPAVKPKKRPNREEEEDVEKLFDNQDDKEETVGRKLVKKRRKKTQEETETPAIDQRQAATNQKSHAEKFSLPIPQTASFPRGGQVLAVGENGMLQLGLASHIGERQNAQPILSLPANKIVQIAAGPLHSICLSDDNRVFTFGCNDEKSLGREQDEDDDAAPSVGEVQWTVPKGEHIVQVVAGDSHTMALTDGGNVFGWGTFRSTTTGPFGLIKKNQIESRPVPISVPECVVKLASGNDFVLFLGVSGTVYSCGNGETGQLGRLSRYSAEDGKRGGIERLLKPSPIVYNRVSVKERQIFHQYGQKLLLFDDIFAGAHGFFLKVYQHDDFILGCGLNNFHQLGLESDEPVYFPTHIRALANEKWAKLAGGLHHTLALTKDGRVFSFGRRHEGQLGLPSLTTPHVSQPSLVPGLPSPIADIACGNHVSFTIDSEGQVFSFGAGTSLQHGHGNTDIHTPTQIHSKFMDIKRVVSIAVGSQHTLFLTHDKEILNTNDGAPS